MSKKKKQEFEIVIDDDVALYILIAIILIAIM